MSKMRLQTVFLINVQLAEADRIRDPRKLFTLPGEEKPEEEIYVPTPEEWDALDERFRELTETGD